MQIIDGYTGQPNIYADDIGQYNTALIGSGDYVLPVGERLGYELVSNNEVKIKDGFFITQGRRGLIKKGSTESCTIENGTQAENRNDLIVIEYAKDEATLIESHTLKVIKGAPGEEGADPEVVTGDIPNGAVLHQMPLYRVKLEGLSVVAVESLFQIGNVSPETVDPMAATESGFAADAAKTGEAIKEVSAKLEQCFQLGSNRKAELVAALQYSNLGITENNTWEEIFEILSEEYPGIECLYPTGTLESGWNKTISNVSLSVNNHGASDPYTKSNNASRTCSVSVDCSKYNKLKIICTITQSGTGSYSVEARLGTASNGTDIKTINLSSGINEIDISGIDLFYLSFYITNTCSGTNVTHTTTFGVTEILLEA